jgi:hypothetical protein
MPDAEPKCPHTPLIEAPQLTAPIGTLRHLPVPREYLGPRPGLCLPARATAHAGAAALEREARGEGAAPRARAARCCGISRAAGSLLDLAEQRELAELDAYRSCMYSP